ncbi:hypothetical protein ACQP2F_46295 [Actinoplanes sp. CA-030573]|uniref:hypothetical protein n=1 Tax=Actinoplanes sp. CA-030573 TaxID=3239898 RepID=UPI003D8BE4D1
MTTQDLQPTTDESLDRAIERLVYALRCEPEEARAILTKDPERRKLIAEIVRREEEEYADFHRELGNR